MLMAFASTLLAASTEEADLVSTDQISEAMRRLVEDYSCADMFGTIAASENPLSKMHSWVVDLIVTAKLRLSQTTRPRKPQAAP